MRLQQWSMTAFAFGIFIVVVLTSLSFADTSQWVNVSGTTSQSGGVLILTGGTTTAKAQVINIAVTPGTQYTLSGQVMNSTSNSWTYIGVNNAGVVTERGSNATSYTGITPIVFTAASNTISVYGSFWQGQTGMGYVRNVALNGVAILSSGSSSSSSASNGTYSWVSVSGVTVIGNTILELDGSSLTARAELQNVAVTPGTVYTVTGNVWNTAGYTYIGVVNGSQVFEQGGDPTTSTAINPIIFTATGNTITVYGSYWKSQIGKGYVSNVALNGVALANSGSSSSSSSTSSGSSSSSSSGNCSGNTYTICDDFNGTTLDSTLWYKVKKNWGGQVSGNTSYNGGVLPENVSVSGGYLHLVGHGDQYAGSLMGINKDGSTRSDGKKVGGGIASVGYYGSGTYEVRMKVLPHFGAVSTIWTFNYQEFPSGSFEYSANNGSGDYWVSNHEIDIEMPGRPAAAATNISFNYALFNTWIGERDSPVEYTTGYTDTGINNNDGNFHVYKIVWHSGSAANRSDSSVMFYIDGVLKRTSSGTADHVPWKKGRIWLANWFANSWAGTPDFDTLEMTVDYFRFTASNDANDVAAVESYPCDGLVGCQ